MDLSGRRRLQDVILFAEECSVVEGIHKKIFKYRVYGGNYIIIN